MIIINHWKSASVLLYSTDEKYIQQNATTFGRISLDHVSHKHAWNFFCFREEQKRKTPSFRAHCVTCTTTTSKIWWNTSHFRCHIVWNSIVLLSPSCGIPFVRFLLLPRFTRFIKYQNCSDINLSYNADALVRSEHARARAHRFIFTQVGQSILLSWVGVKNMSQDRKQCGWGVIEFVRVYIVYVEFYFIRYNNWHEIRRTLICIWLAVICDWNRLQYHVLYQWKDNLSLYPRIASNCFDLITLELNYVYVLPLACECVLRHLLIRDSCL